MEQEDFLRIREAIGAIPGDVSNDAVGNHVPKLQDIYAPATHAAALDPATPIVVGARGAGKSFWSGVLGQENTRNAAAKAYPKLGLDRVTVYFGFTGIGGPEGIGRDHLAKYVPEGNLEAAKAFWWATILRASNRATGNDDASIAACIELATDWERREQLLSRHDQQLRAGEKLLIVVYDALDMLATSWPRRRMLTESLLEVVWEMRAYRAIRMKLFLRPDQIDDDGLRFVELPKLRAGAVRLSWTGTDLYGLLYSRIALAEEPAKRSFAALLRSQGIPQPTRDDILSRQWTLAYDVDDQTRVMALVAGPYMAAGSYGYKKGKTYDWPVTHLADAFDEVTPRSFLSLMIAAAKFGTAPPERVITPDGIRHGLREASKTRVDQLDQEFPWIKGVLAPLAGLLLPQSEKYVFQAWKKADTINQLLLDAKRKDYLPPFPFQDKTRDADLFEAMRRIGVMFRRKDDRIDMPDLFRVAAKLLKKGGTAPV